VTSAGNGMDSLLPGLPNSATPSSSAFQGAWAGQPIIAKDQSCAAWRSGRGHT
jgi:hypothetical protein